MSAYDQSKKLADKRAEMASEDTQQGKAAVEQSFRLRWEICGIIILR